METPTVTKEMFIEALLNDFTDNTPPDEIFKNSLATINLCMAVSKIDDEKWNEIFSKRREMP